MTADRRTSVVPDLRFPEFHNAGDWHFQPLSDVAETISDRVGTTKCVPMSVTTGVGLVSQEDKFGHVIAGDSYKNYIRLQTSDFAYNKSATKEFPQGYIARYTGTKDAAVPNSIFTCFRPNTSAVIPEYLDHLFQGNYHGRWLRRYITVGARAHGALSVSNDDLMALPVPLPPLAVSRREQQKIADCLGSLDDLLATEGKKLAALRQHKQGLMQLLFPQSGETAPRLRFPQFQESPEWRVEPIDAFAQVTTGNRDTQDKVDWGDYTFFVRSQSTERINTYAYDGEAVLTSGDGVGVGRNFHYINGRFDFHQRVYCIYDFRPHVLCRFFYFYFSEHFGPRVRRVSAKNSVDSVRRSMITDMRVPLPGPAEQEVIADCLSSLETRISGQANKVAALGRFRHGLQQQLFPSPEGE
jgi:type I restriction enzyme, S subunit